MLGAFRRTCAASARSLCSTSISNRNVIDRATSSFRHTHVSPLRLASVRSVSISASLRQHATAEAVPETTETVPYATTFEDLRTYNLVDSSLVDTLVKDMKLESMTEVQSKTIREALSGVDLIGQAKTGTGKTIAFLLPIMQRILQEDPMLARRSGKRASPEDIRAIIISPTRELAEQIGVEASKLAYRTGIKVQLAVGGTQKNMMLRKLQAEGCHLLVGTPGRLRDILSDDYSRVRAPLLTTFVLDEADRLLDAGFSREIEDIKHILENPVQTDRQTMLFSATIHPDIVALVRRTLRPGFKFVQCVRPDEEPTHERVLQKMVRVAGLENQMPALVELCQRELAASLAGEKKPFKAMIFFNSTAEVSLARETMQILRRDLLSSIQVIEIHSKLTQAQRTRAAENFRRASSALMLTTDVTARGMDFPDVTHVIQVGLPSNNDSYVHRLGRTARAGKEGEGWIFISPIEEKEARIRLRGMRIQSDNSLKTAEVDMARPADMPAEAAQIIDSVCGAFKIASPESMETSYRAGLGVFLKWAPKHLTIESLNKQSLLLWGMPQPPQISSSLASKLGYAGVPGVNIGGGMYGGSRGGFSDRRDSFGSRGRNDSFGSRGFDQNDPFGTGGFGDSDNSFPPRGADHNRRGLNNSFSEGRSRRRTGGYEPRQKY